MYVHIDNNLSNRNRHKRFEEKFGSHSRNTFKRFSKKTATLCTSQIMLEVLQAEN
jgi:hypothetical protein